MRWLSAFCRRLLGLVRRRRLEQDLDDELAFHLAMREADHRDAGLPPDLANVAARRQFGSVTLLKEQACGSGSPFVKRSPRRPSFWLA